MSTSELEADYNWNLAILSFVILLLIFHLIRQFLFHNYQLYYNNLTNDYK